ncbi:Z1 domain-containing protein [Kribbella sp. CA-293567]|uniref:Z1 domain-containing protein n=1 Tax=Kribbella sp. CA-293567 TaxID=3002436 RepID=UPI0022DD5DE0|nr:Z1 domain-containing protein [Kribbella sp. CA-293567]WBQ07814.1 Z1 domain-containing protein [Kribbella sp. CA-293567]
MSSDWLRDSLRQVLRGIEGGPPKNLVARIRPDAEDRGEQVTSADIGKLIRAAVPTDAVLKSLGLQVHKWDAESSAVNWTGGSGPSSVARRAIICQILGLDDDGAAALLEKRPLFVDETVVITAPWEKWYTTSVATAHEFYWPRYRDYLLDVRRWPDENVTALDVATTSVVERLSDPTRPKAFQAKGLVVGYVQSGKTANFTGVIAKAIDSGYRLVIVLTGTIEMLRAQTQRRVDMEMVGRQNIVGDASVEEARAARYDYQDDPDWLNGRFLDLQTVHIESEIERLTTHGADYRTEFKRLKIDRFDMGKPLYDPANLFGAAARLVITKKNSTVLGRLVEDIKANRRAFAEIPVLIIDDESDQASVNTVDPEKVESARAAGREVKERRAINERIAEMLGLMPRAQYVGYTATPFANVFVDPSDEQGIYPKDFVIGLRRPPGYMGVDDFHDLGEERVPETAERSNRKAFVRDLVEPEESSARDMELATALHMFVLTGACKLYRQALSSELTYRHHTMLIHESVAKEEQKDLALLVRRLWKTAKFDSPKGLKRLQELYESDVLPVSLARTEVGVPALPHFDTLRPSIINAIGKITEHDDNPVLVVNSDKEIEQQRLDFDRNSTWRVLIGGAKLSRGFTVEGLTVTYFRRAVTMSDSLTQMGRWFGFRQGYRDLVRLYIDRNAKFGRKSVDLYSAFEAIAHDEAAFRSQLTQYAKWDGNKPRLLPSQIPPLVTQHLPWLKPTSRNKMFNAVLQEQSEQFFSPSGYPNEVDKLHANLSLWRPLLTDAAQEVAFPAAGQQDLTACIGVVDAGKGLDLMARLHWMNLYAERSVAPVLAYYDRLVHGARRQLNDFLLVMPQPGGKIAAIDGVGKRRIINRDRRPRGNEELTKFGEITDPKHRRQIMPLLQSTPPPGGVLADAWAPGRGVILVYLVREQNPGFLDGSAPAVMPPDDEYGLIVGFSVYLPHTVVGSDRILKFKVRQGVDPTVVTVDAID